MFCCHRNRPHRSYRSYKAYAADDRGAAAVEGLLVVALLGGLFLAGLLLAQWGIGLQSAQMGARLLAFDVGDVTLARLGKPANLPVQQFTSATWDTLVNRTHADWLSGMFALSNGDFSGSVTGTVHGRIPGQRSMFAYTYKTMGYYSNGWSAASYLWAIPESVLRSTFTRIAYYVGYYRVSPSGLNSTCAQPIPRGDTVLETFYHLVGQ